MQVSQSDVASLESKWNLSVLRIRQHPGQAGPANPSELTLIMNLVCDQVHSTHSGAYILFIEIYVCKD
jgi:hypothetical protein